MHVFKVITLIRANQSRKDAGYNVDPKYRPNLLKVHPSRIYKLLNNSLLDPTDGTNCTPHDATLTQILKQLPTVAWRGAVNTVGWSLGGYVGQTVALTWPERVSHLGIAGLGPGAPTARRLMDASL
jgi:pimeloyl-ACP methyl ester carboxylesterase